MSNNFELILEKLFTEAGMDISDHDYDDITKDFFSDYTDEFDNIVTLATEKYGYEQLEGDHGGEGEGEYCYSVIKLDGKYYHAEWSYYSYNGCEYSGIYNTVREVKPVQKLVTVYE